MTLAQLIYFRKLSKVLHYTRAAQELHVSQPSLSYSIAELEKELGINLFEKADKKLHLSPYGKCFLEYINIALDSIDDGVKQLQSMHGADSGTVRLGYIYSLSSTFVPQLIQSFKSSDNNLKINFQFVQDLHYNLISALNSGELDLALCVNEDPKTVSKPILEQELYLIVPNDHPLSLQEDVSLLDIAKFPLVLLHNKSGLNKLIMSEFKKENIVPQVIFEAHECNATLQFVTHNLGITIIPEVPAIEHLPVSKIKIKNANFVRKIYLSWSNMIPLIPAAKKVRDYILSQRIAPFV